MKRADYAISVFCIYWAGYLGYLLGAHQAPAAWFHVLMLSPFVIAVFPFPKPQG